MIDGANPEARISWALVWTTKVLWPKIVPVGRFELAEPMALATSSIPIARAASSRGSTSIRTAYFWEPKTSICATPATIDSRCAIDCCAYSSIIDKGSVADRSTSRITD